MQRFGWPVEEICDDNSGVVDYEVEDWVIEECVRQQCEDEEVWQRKISSSEGGSKGRE